MLIPAQTSQGLFPIFYRKLWLVQQTFYTFYLFFNQLGAAQAPAAAPPLASHWGCAEALPALGSTPCVPHKHPWEMPSLHCAPRPCLVRQKAPELLPDRSKSSVPNSTGNKDEIPAIAHASSPDEQLLSSPSPKEHPNSASSGVSSLLPKATLAKPAARSKTKAQKSTKEE